MYVRMKIKGARTNKKKKEGGNQIKVEIPPEIDEWNGMEWNRREKMVAKFRNEVSISNEKWRI